MTLQAAIVNNIFEDAKRVGADICIAGGAVVDFDKASDIDVFIFNSRCYELAKAIDPEFVNLCDERYDDSTFQVIARCQPVWSPKPIQITHRKDCNNIGELLAQFDLSIHQWAIRSDLQLEWVSTSTGIGEPIRVLRVDPTTPARLVKLSQRYFPAKAAA